MYFHKGNHSLSGAGHCYIYVIQTLRLPLAPQGVPGPGPARAAAWRALQALAPARRAEAAFSLVEKQVQLIPPGQQSSTRIRIVIISPTPSNQQVKGSQGEVTLKIVTRLTRKTSKSIECN